MLRIKVGFSRIARLGRHLYRQCWLVDVTVEKDAISQHGQSRFRCDTRIWQSSTGPATLGSQISILCLNGIAI
jgi:hypothetical protein